MTNPKYLLEKRFTIRSYESGVKNEATPATYCNYFQEIAGEHANALGIGIHSLQSHQVTWMLTRLRMGIRRYAAWGEEVSIRTWPSACEGRLLALRDFQFRDGQGALIAEGISEWVNVDLTTRRLTRLPADFVNLVAPDTQRAGEEIAIPSEKHQPPFPGPAAWSATLGVRMSDLDFNNHVNNVHYLEWALECLPEDFLAAHHLSAFDISFKAEALRGDTVRSEAAPLPEGSRLAHRILRESTTLATLATRWI